MQEILPRAPTGPPELISPALFGELSRRLPSELAVQKVLPRRNGLVGNSSGPVLRSFVTACGALRKTSLTRRFAETTTIALRSLAEFQMFPARSSAMPSVPSSRGWATKTLSMHSVFAVNVVSQPVALARSPWRLNCTFQIAPRAVSATNRLPSWSKATPLATSGCEPRVLAALRLVGVTVMVPGGSVLASRPTPPTPSASRFTPLAIGWMRNTSTTTPDGEILQTRPWPVVPSPVHRLPSRSNARPLVPGTPVAKAVASGGVVSLGFSVQTVEPSAMYRLPNSSKVMPEG